MAVFTFEVLSVQQSVLWKVPLIPAVNSKAGSEAGHKVDENFKKYETDNSILGTWDTFSLFVHLFDMSS